MNGQNPEQDWRAIIVDEEFVKSERIDRRSVVIGFTHLNCKEDREALGIPEEEIPNFLVIDKNLFEFMYLKPLDKNDERKLEGLAVSHCHGFINATNGTREELEELALTAGCKKFMDKAQFAANLRKILAIH